MRFKSILFTAALIFCAAFFVPTPSHAQGEGSLAAAQSITSTHAAAAHSGGQPAAPAAPAEVPAVPKAIQPPGRIRCKFRVRKITPNIAGEGELNITVILDVVTNGSKENESFSKYTPSGELRLNITNPDIEGFFWEGQEYFVDLSPGNVAVTPAPLPGDPSVRPEVAQAKCWRKRLDEITCEMKGAKGSRELSLAITKTEEAIMWLGKNLQAIDKLNPGAAPNPYPESKNPSSDRVEPAADGLKN